MQGLACSGVVVVEGWQLAGPLSALVHEGLDGLFVAAGLHFVQGRVNDLAVDSLELAVSAEVDLNIRVLGEELTQELEECKERLVEGGLLHVGRLGHHREVGLDEGPKLDLSLNFVFLHLWVVVKAVQIHKVVVDLDVGSAFVVRQGLEADNPEVGQVHGPLHLILPVAPS
jgi:hypothetical protein